MRLRIAMFLAASLSLSLFNLDLFGVELTSPTNHSSAMLQQPLLFQPNHGQQTANIEYFAHGRTYSVQLKKKGAKIQFRNHEGCESELEISLEGSQPNPLLRGIRNAEAKVHYFIGNNPRGWRTNISTFGAVLYKDVYPGIDWMFYERDGNLEYDFLVAPGADASQIRMDVQGADQVEVDPAGNLNVTTEAGPVQMLVPMVFQESQQIQTKYQLVGNNQVVFSIGEYDPEKLLTIDPVISFGTLLGGNTFDNAADVVTDNKGNIYVVGYTEANSRIPGNGDGFIYKFSPAGSVIWSSFLVGSAGELVKAITVAPNGICYLTGTTNSRDFPIVGGFQTQLAGGNDAFLVKLAANGSTIVRSSYLGGSGSDLSVGISLGSGPKLRNGIYIYGTTDSRNFPRTKAPQQQFGGGNLDGFVAVIHAVNFQRLMSTYVGREGNDTITSLALNTVRGDLYAGFLSDGVDGDYIAQFKTISSSGVPITSYDLAINRTSVLGLNSQRRLSPNVIGGWMSLMTASWRPIKLGLRELAQPGIILANSSCIPVTPATSCNDVGSLLFLDQDLNRLSFINFGGPLTAQVFVNDMTLDRNGTIYLVGDTLSKTLPKVNAFQPAYKGGWEGFVMGFAPGTGQLTLSSYLGGNAFDFAAAVTTDNESNILIVGQTSTKKFPTTPSALKRTVTGTADGYVVKITP